MNAAGLQMGPGEKGELMQFQLRFRGGPRVKVGRLSHKVWFWRRGGRIP